MSDMSCCWICWGRSWRLHLWLNQPVGSCSIKLVDLNINWKKIRNHSDGSQANNRDLEAKTNLPLRVPQIWFILAMVNCVGYLVGPRVISRTSMICGLYLKTPQVIYLTPLPLLLENTSSMYCLTYASLNRKSHAYLQKPLQNNKSD